MNRKALLAAAVLAMVGIVLLFIYMQRYEHEARGGDLVQVVVATQDIPLGAGLTEEMLGVRAVPQAYVEERHIPVREARRILGIRIRNAVRANEAVLWTDLATTTNQSRNLSGLIQNSMRAVTVNAALSSVFGGLLQPGDRVDVLLTTQRQPGQIVTITLLQNILVLAVGQDLGGIASEDPEMNAFGRSNQVTLSATMEEAQLLVQAQQQGSLQLMMRNPDDITIAENLPETTAADIIEQQRRQRFQRRPSAPSGPERVE